MARTIVPDENEEAKWGDRDHLEVARQKTFTQMVFELLSEREPSPDELKIFELILNLSIDHGPDTPSAIPTIEAAKEGKSMSEAVAAGILQIGDTHGGAAQPLMSELYKIKNNELEIKSLVSNYLSDGKKLPGFGHRIYKDLDPRAEIIFQAIGENEFIAALKEIQQEMESQSGKHLPINIDGAIAAALCSFGWDPELGIAVFLIARTPGLIGQYLNHS